MTRGRQGLSIFGMALFCVVVFGSPARAQTPDIQPLTIEKPIERELKGDESHSHSITLQAGQYVDIVVQQKGIDVVVALFDPAGTKIVEVDSPNGTNGPEPIYLIVKATGVFLLEVRSLEKTATTGRYEARVVEQRASVENDKVRLAARKASDEANAMGLQRTGASMREAIKRIGDVLIMYRSIGDKRGEAKALLDIGSYSSDVGDKQKGIDHFTLALPIFRELGNKYNEAITLNNIALAYRGLGEKEKALDYYFQALTLFRALGSTFQESVTLSNIGVAYLDLDENVKAIEYFSQSLLLARSVGDKNYEAFDLVGLGIVYSNLGEYQKSLDYYTQALQLARKIGNKRGESQSLTNIGKVYSALGEAQQALEYHNRSLSLFRETGDKPGEVTALNNIAAVYTKLGEYKKALDSFFQMLPIVQSIRYKAVEAAVHNNIGTIYLRLGEKQKALKYYDQAVLLFRALGDKGHEAGTLNGIGNVYSELGDTKRAIVNYGQSLPLQETANDRADRADSFRYLLHDWRSAGNLRLAVFFGKLSVNNYQILRSNVNGLEKNIQQTYLKSIEGVYRDLANALIGAGRIAEAQQVLNLFKDQQYFDFKSNKQTAPLTLTPREANVSSQLDHRLGAVVAAIRAADDFKRSIGSRPPTVDEAAQIKSLEVKLAAANDDYNAFLKQAEKEFAAPPDEMDKVPDIVDVKAMQDALRSTSASTKQKTVAVYTLVGENGFRTLLITPDTITSAAYAIKGKDFNEKALKFWKLLRTPKYDPRDAANELYKIVFEPLADNLPKDTKTILWSLDGNLRYVPMATLFDGKRYLVERYQNVVFTRADKEQMTKNVSNVRSGTGFGSSESHKVTMGNDTYNASALPSVKTELGRIFKQGNRGVLNGDVLLDASFTKTAMLDAMKTHRPLVHIASHFLFEPGDEARSFLLLGDGTPFTLDEMKTQKDLFAGVELLALSACQTAAQRPDANGREVDGFAELAQRLGAGAVMASLWEVSDSSTAELMTRFYRNYSVAAGANKATALQNAQIALLKGTYKTVDPAQRELEREKAAAVETVPNAKPFRPSQLAPYAHPYYWSPFILIGNWK